MKEKRENLKAYLSALKIFKAEMLSKIKTLKTSVALAGQDLDLLKARQYFTQLINNLKEYK